MTNRDNSDLDDEEKLELLWQLKNSSDDEIDEVLTNWEKDFLETAWARHSITNCEISPREARTIDEIYEKLWQKDLLK